MPIELYTWAESPDQARRFAHVRKPGYSAVRVVDEGKNPDGGVQLVGDPWWLDQHGKRVKVGGIAYRLNVWTLRSLRPYPHDIIRVDAEPVNKKSEYYREIKHHLGDDWTTDVLASPEFAVEVEKQLR
jgi:hypothetical protein